MKNVSFIFSSGISSRFQLLSQSLRQVTYVLLTLAPLDGYSSSASVQALPLHRAISFDLHVLGMPPAFILSQDQTLQIDLFSFVSLAFRKLTFCSVFKDLTLSCCFFLQVALLIYQTYSSKSSVFLTFFLFFAFLLHSTFSPFFLASFLKCPFNISPYLLLCQYISFPFFIFFLKSKNVETNNS